MYVDRFEEYLGVKLSYSLRQNVDKSLIMVTILVLNFAFFAIVKK